MKYVEMHIEYNDEADLYSAHRASTCKWRKCWSRSAMCPEDAAIEIVEVFEQFEVIQGALEMAYNLGKP